MSRCTHHQPSETFYQAIFPMLIFPQSRFNHFINLNPNFVRFIDLVFTLFFTYLQSFFLRVFLWPLLVIRESFNGDRHGEN